MELYGEYFYGNKISPYGLKHKRLDYRTLSRAFDHVLNNDIIKYFDFEWFSGDTESEVFQWYIVSENGAEMLQEIGEIVLYASEPDMYIWGVDHYGTSWDYVLTDVPCCTGNLPRREVE